jgi:hypothetical protein
VWITGWEHGMCLGPDAAAPCRGQAVWLPAKGRRSTPNGMKHGTTDGYYWTSSVGIDGVRPLHARLAPHGASLSMAVRINAKFLRCVAE